MYPQEGKAKMDYSFQVSTPPNTPKDKAIQTEMELTEGIITYVWMLHPRGCHGVAHATISDGLSQIWPTNKDADYAGNGVPIEFQAAYRLLPPAKLWLITWNTSTLFDHSIFVHIVVEPEEQALPYKALLDFIAVLKKLVGL